MSKNKPSPASWGRPAQQQAAPAQQPARGARTQQWEQPVAQQPQAQGQRDFNGMKKGKAFGVITGNLACDPASCEVRAISNGQGGFNYCVTVPVVVNEDGEPSVFLCTFWNDLGRNLCEYKSKGHGLMLEVKMTNRKGTDGTWYPGYSVKSALYLN